MPMGKLIGYARVSMRQQTTDRQEADLKADQIAAGTSTHALHALLDAADSAGIWMIQSSIFPENTASLAPHRRAGFRDVGTRQRIALVT